MYVDVCFPDNNEKDFVEMAKRIGIGGLLFLYDDLPKEKIKTEKIKIWYGIYCKNPNKKSKSLLFTDTLKRNIPKNENLVYFYTPEEEKKKSFHFPTRKNHVLIKELKEKNKLFGFSFVSIKDTKNFEKIEFFINLCKKYDINSFLASFARQPYFLRNEIHMRALGKAIGMMPKTTKTSLHLLGDFLMKHT